VDDQRFDRLAKTIAGTRSRRRLLGGGIGAFGAALLPAFGRRRTAAQEGCAEGLTDCGGVCVDLASSPLNCGECGRECFGGDQPGGVCVGGACADCPPAQIACYNEPFGLCVDPANDPLNCGVCGNICGSGVCENGACVTTVACPDGQVDCRGRCTDLASDFENCGACFVYCPSQQCRDGVCVTCEELGLGYCAGQGVGNFCTDLSTSPYHCGTCGNECPSGVCADGACVAAATETPEGQGEGYELRVGSALCQAPPPQPPTFKGADCAPAAGVLIRVVSQATGELLGTCTTDTAQSLGPAAGCSMLIPYETDVLVSQDPSTLPAGYAPTLDTIFTGSPPPGPPMGLLSSPIFINLPMGDDEAEGGTPAPATETGTTPAATEPGASGTPPAVRGEPEIAGGIEPEATATTSRRTAGTATADCPRTSEDGNEALARRWFDEFSRGDLAAMEGLVADDVVDHLGGAPPAEGVPAVMAGVEPLLVGFPDLRYRVEQAITEDDLVVLRWTATGTQEGEFQGRPPTGREATWTGIAIFRVECGRIAEIWREADALGRLRQLGAMPTATPAT